jgi:glycosyltransferase involved in cell wall biosynthesis
MAGRLMKLSNFLASLNPGEVEVIVILDIYDPATSKELVELISSFPLLKIKFCRDYYGSPGAARNAGLEIATSEWVWFCDADDEPIIDIALNALKVVTDEYDALIFNYSKVDEISGIEYLNLGIHDRISICLNPGLWRMLVKKSIIQSHKFEKYLLGEDQLFILKTGVFHRKILFINEKVYKYSYGGKGHLVDRRDKTHDLFEVFKKTFFEIDRVDNAESKFVSLLALRQLLTILKIGPMRLRVLAFLLICRLSLKKPRSVLQLMITIPIFLKRQSLL